MAKGEETRNRIIEQAAPLFNKYGVAGVSISDIMRATNLQKGGIYRHFDSKEEIALAAFDYNYQVLTDHIMIGVSRQESPHSALTNFLANFATLPNLLEGGCAVLNTAIEHDDGNPALRNRAREAAQNWHHTLIRILRRGQNEGVFQMQHNLDEVATLYISALEGGIMLTQLHQNQAYIRQVIRQLQQHARQNIFQE